MTETTKPPKKDRREYNRAWHAANKDRVRERMKGKMAEWRAANPEKARAARQRSNKSQAHAAGLERYKNAHPPDKFYKIQRRSSLKRRYNLTLEQWDEMFAAQGFVCANRACGVDNPGKSWWHTDHCHATKRLRAILCKSCNMALGVVKDNPAVLRGLADYLQHHSNLGNSL